MPDSAYALYLMSAARTVEVTDAGLAARWGVTGHDADVQSPLESEAAASGEGARRIAFRCSPVAQDRVVLGQAVALDSVRGRCVAIGEETMFVLGGTCDHAGGISVLDVLRMLA